MHYYLFIYFHNCTLHILIIPLITLQTDGRCAYYYVGAVWKSMKTRVSRLSHVSDTIEKMFLTKETARKRGLPTHTVDTRYVLGFVGERMCVIPHLPSMYVSLSQDVQVSPVFQFRDIPAFPSASR